MSDARRLTTQGQERKQQLIECAGKLFAERGYADTRVIDICKAAGVAKGLFYWYFDNKDQLFRELAEDIRFRLRKCQADAIDDSAEPLTRIRQGAEASVRFMSDHARFFSLLEVENAGRHFTDVLQQGTDIHVRDTRILVEEGIAAGQIRDEDPALLAAGVVGIVGLYGHFHRTGRAKVPVEELAGLVGRFVVHSLAADDQAADLALGVQVRQRT